MLKITEKLSFETVDIVSEPLHVYRCSENGHATLVCNECDEKMTTSCQSI